MEQLVQILRDLTPVSAVVRILLAVFLGGLIGLNRGRQGRAAGLRTHALVCLGSALAIMVGIYSVEILGLSGDPTRIGAQVVSGIGFLGVGTILTRSEHRITGLTTAAGLWATASVGLAIGIGFYLGAVLGGGMVILTMTWINRIVKTKDRSGPKQRLYLESPDEQRFTQVLDDLSARNVEEIEVKPARTGLAGHVGLCVSCAYEEGPELQQALMKLREDGSVMFFLEDR